MKEIQEHQIKICELPETDDEEEKLVKNIKDRLPLAVDGPNTVIEVNSKPVRGRTYPWGVAEKQKTGSCEVTDNGVDTRNQGQLTKSPRAQMEDEGREQVAQMKETETEMEQVFETKARENIQKLKDSEAECQQHHEQMKKNLETQRFRGKMSSV
ncbi:hypothetical protein HPG69_011108 [Diceros bicornis minor]|uniref:Septin-type G domain-containing protein n=1 Tax=Diceros bicornis minor TaxID=77932 RepID=A0A7J7FJ86_DICBM|nr:hypothetical protein HPG69_011108 [Diceros bicornis minor]